MRLHRRLFLSATGSALCMPSILRGGSTKLELDLLLDGSGSMFEETILGAKTGRPSDNHIIQRESHINALLLPEIADFLIWHKVHVKVYAWSTYPLQITDVVVSSQQALAHLVSSIDRNMPRRKFGQSTLHDVVLNEFALPPPVGIRRVIDLATDEQPLKYRERWCREARDAIASYEGTVNILAVDDLGFIADKLQEVLQTPNGFTEVAKGYGDYERALIRKLIGELY